MVSKNLSAKWDVQCGVQSAVVKCQNFSAVREHFHPDNRYLPLAIRHSLPFSARQEPRPPNFSRPSSHDPRPVKSRRSVSSSSTTD